MSLSAGSRLGPYEILSPLGAGGNTTHRWPYFLPDGEHILYLAANHASPRSEENGIYVVSLRGGAPRRLMSANGSA